MPQLPRLTQRLDPGLGGAGYLAPRNRPAPVGDLASGVGQLAGGLDAYQQAAARVQAREDTITRTMREGDFSEAASELYRGQLTAGGFTGKGDVLAFRQAVDQLVSETLGGYQGGAESRARLAERLTAARGELLAKAAGEAVTTQRARIRDTVSRQANQITAGLLQDPGSLPTAWADIDRVIDDVADALTPEEEIETRALFRAQTAGAAVEGLLAYGDTQGALELLAVPGVAESLPPAQQTAFARQITLMRRDEEQRRNARRQSLEDAAFALGTTVDQLPMWARLQAVGMQGPPAAPQAQSGAGKLVQDRELFVRQYGEDSPQVASFDAMAASGGEPPSLADARGIRQEFTRQSTAFVEVRDAFARVETAATSPSAAGDLALIFNFMKILDPGSVVREGEFATAEKAAGVPDQIRNQYNRLLSGERLGEAQRADFIGQARGLYQVQLRNHRLLEEQYAGLATRAGIRPEDVIIDFVGDDGAPVVPPPGAAGAGQARVAYGMDGLPLGAGEGG